MTVYTIGFTKTSAERFFTRLKNSGARRLVDVRLNNVSQLAGFAKRDDLAYFLRVINSMEYLTRPELAPTHELLNAYRNHRMTWTEYESAFLELMAGRGVENSVQQSEIDGSCLLCSEPKADRCHRRLVAEYLASRWEGLEIIHL